MTVYIKQQVQKCLKRKPCRLSQFFHQHKFTSHQKKAFLQLIQESNEETYQMTKKQIDDNLLQSDYEQYSKTPECQQYNKEHFENLLMILSSVRNNGIQVGYLDNSEDEFC